MESLEDFIERVPEFKTLSPVDQMPFFSYYLQEITGIKPFLPKQVENCFHDLHLKPYSNVPRYLTSKSKGKGHLFLKGKNGYTLERSHREQIEEKLGTVKIKKPSNNLFPLEIFKGTRGYLESVATQAVTAYDYGLFDASSVMLRRLLETLIIEAFEKFKIESKITNAQGFYFYLQDLITEFVKEQGTFKASRNTLTGIPKLKKLGDWSAHSRRYLAKKSDIDNVKDDLRMTLEELVHIIDYKSSSTTP